MITVNSFPHDFDSLDFVQNIQSGPDPCNPFTDAVFTPPYEGLGSIVAVWQGTTTKTAPGAVLTVTGNYRPF
jgi:hypothetical protein